MRDALLEYACWGHALWEDPGLKNAWLIIAWLVEVRRGRARGQIAHKLNLLLLLLLLLMLLLLLLIHEHLHHLLQVHQRVFDR